MVESTFDLKKIREQIEYYMSDLNLSRDKFFREQIQTDKEGWVALSHFLNCNKVKTMKIATDQIVTAIMDGPSEQLELSKDNKKLRRIGSPALPELARKREAKAADKGHPSSKPKVVQEDEIGPDGKIMLTERDFDDPLIIAFKVEDVKEGEEFKVDWKQVESAVKEKFPGLKLVYSRADPHGGQIAFSQLRIKEELVTSLVESKLSIQDKEFTFSKLEGEGLKEFWTKEHGHYKFCIAPKIRAVKKQAKNKQMEKREGVKRAKTSYEIAGVYYLDINKVKSKSRAILNIKKDGERLEGPDEEFIKYLLLLHDKADAKLKDFEAFEVGTHPDFDKTRCFFVVRKDGSKEDFSVTKCIHKLETHQEDEK